MTTIKYLLETAPHCLSSSLSPRLDSEILLAYAIEKNRAFLYAYPEYGLTGIQMERFAGWIQAREEGWPVAYLVGEREFWSLPLKVTEATLIPRPETELLVENALCLLQEKNACVLDMGTGSGAIALACAHERPDWQIMACDCSLPALKVAQENSYRLHINNIKFYLSEWFSSLDPTYVFDMILSNPPYIAENDSHLSEGDLRFEPRLALEGGMTGLEAIHSLVKESKQRLKLGGWLCIEHGYQQKEDVQSMLRKYGYEQIDSWYDGQGHARVSIGRRTK